MNKSSILIILISLCLLLMAGCEDTTTNPADKQFDSLYPIAEGNWWAVSTPFCNTIDTLRYIPSEIIGADDEIGWNTVSWDSNEGINHMLAKHTEDGLIYSWDTTKKKPYSLLGMKTTIKLMLSKSDKGGNTAFASYLIAKFPINLNDQWVMMSDETTDINNEPAVINDVMKCIAMYQEVETPAGAFECIVYRESFEFVGAFNDDQDSDFVRFYYYSEGVGLIKVLFVDNIENEVTVEYELVDYHIQ